MSVTIGNLTFDRVRYDAAGDVLYLQAGEPQAAAAAEGTPEGHVVRYDRDGRIIGLTIINARWLVTHEGGITVTLPAPTLHAEAHALAEVLGLGMA